MTNRTKQTRRGRDPRREFTRDHSRFSELGTDRAADDSINMEVDEVTQSVVAQIRVNCLKEGQRV